MRKRNVNTIYLCLLAGILLASTGVAALPEGLVGYWKLDEGSGTVAGDSSDVGNDGTLVGDPEWVDGYMGYALELNGGTQLVEIPSSPEIEFGGGKMTMMVWVRFNETGLTMQYQKVLSKKADFNAEPGYSLAVEPPNSRVVIVGSGNTQARTTVAFDNEWHHMAATIDGTAGQVYYDGVAIDMEEDRKTVGPISGEDRPLLIGAIGGLDSSQGTYYDLLGAAVDEVQLYRRVLTADEIRVAMEGAGGFGPATRPSPEDGALLRDEFATLEWRPGDMATSHQVYFSTDFDDVNDVNEAALIGTTTEPLMVVGFAGGPVPDGLQPDTVYYWRVVEVDEAHADSPWPSDVWSFRLPPEHNIDPYPADGAVFTKLDTSLNWTPGMHAKAFFVTLGTDADEVANAPAATGTPVMDTAMFDPEELTTDTTYYWRVDWFDGTAEFKTGPVWSFTTIPDVAVEDPNLVLWYRLDEGTGNEIVDWSGHGNHGTCFGSYAGPPEWTAPGVLYDTALNFEQGGYIASHFNYPAGDRCMFPEVTVSTWIRTSSPDNQIIVSADRNGFWRLEVNYNHEPGELVWVVQAKKTTKLGCGFRIDDGQWHHICGVFFEGLLEIWVDGVKAAEMQAQENGFGHGKARYMFVGANTEAETFNGKLAGGGPLLGDMQDLRIYDRALKYAEIEALAVLP